MSRRQDIKAVKARPEPGQRPRLAFYVHSMHGGGAERVFALISSGFARRGYPVDLVLNRAEGPHMAFVAPEARVVSLDCSTAAALPKLVAWLRTERPACLVSALSHSNLIGALAARALGTPFAATVHTVESKHRRSLRNTGLLGARLSPLVYRMADAVGVVSEAVGQDIPYAAKRPDKFHVVYNPVDTSHFSPRKVSGEEATVRLPNEDGSPIVLAVGQFYRAKNFGLLLEALTRMLAPVRLVLLGEGPDRSHLEALAHTLGVADRVHMPGFIADPAPWYRRAAVVAAASRYEGFGNIIVEALATGTPVVAAECVGGLAEILDHGRYGSIVPQDDPKAMAEALTQAIQDPLPADKLIGRASAFCLDTVLDRYEAMLQAAMRHAGANQTDAAR